MRSPLILAALLLAAATAQAQNLVIYTDSLDPSWSNYSWATVNLANASPVHSGTASIYVNDPTSTDYQALYLAHSPFNPSALYQNLNFWIYPTVAGSNELLVQATVSGTAQSDVFLSFTSAQVGKWQQITLPFTTLGVANNSNFDGFWIQNQTGAPLTFYVDDISLTALAPPSTVPLSVTPYTAINTIDPRFNGINLAAWDSYVNTPATTSALAAMGIGSIRFPGGSLADDYDWQTDMQNSNPTFQWASHAAIFAATAANQGAQPFVTVNYGSGTPQEAAAWVAYYNAATTGTLPLGTDSKGRNWQTTGYWASIRAASPLSTDDGYNFLRISHSAPFGFTYWELGNEVYGSWENDLHGASGSTLSGAAHDPYTYAVAFQTYAAAMHAVDSTIHLGAVATPGEDSYGVGTHGAPNPAEGNSVHTGWVPVMLATMKSEGVTPAFIIDHIYPEEPGSESDSALLQDTGVVKSDCANLQQMIANYFGTSGSSIELDVTELNSVSFDPGKQSVSLVNGLYLVDAYANVAESPAACALWWDLRNGGDTSQNNSSSLYGWREFGDYGVLAYGDISGTPLNTPFPPYYGHQILTYWAQPGAAVLSATSTYSLLTIHATKFQNGSLALLVVNKNPTTDQPASITYPGFTPGSTSAATWSYGKPNDLNSTGISSGATTVSGTSLTYTFPSYSMTVLQLKSQFEAWREANFTSNELTNWSISGDNGEPAGDGTPNLLKYALNIPAKSPTNAASLPAIGQTVSSGSTYLTLTFTQQSSLTDITYTVQSSIDLVNWSSGPTRIDNGATTTAVYRDTAPITPASSHRFLRLVVNRL
jgi:alpha-L-arabinofuranosidase